MRKLQKESLGCDVDSNDTNLKSKFGSRQSWCQDFPLDQKTFTADEIEFSLVINPYK